MTTEKKLRVAIAGQWEEVNTFAVETMGLATITGNTATGFQKFEGKQILDQFQGTATPIGGYVDALDEASAEIVPTIYYSNNSINYPAASSGVLKAKTNTFLRGMPLGMYPQRFNPALNPDEDLIWVLGFRVRLAFQSYVESSSARNIMASSPTRKEKGNDRAAQNRSLCRHGN